MEVVIATHNLHKLREMRVMLKDLQHCDFTSVADYPDYAFPPEEGSTFEENALAKADHAHAQIGKWVISDDSGLVVPALQGRPGVYSARYAGRTASDRENRRKLLQEMTALQGIERTAYFECVIALVGPGLKKTFRGICEGFISTEERGKNGFGYDPIFIKHDYAQTFAELSEDIKNRISHRAKAINKALLFLESVGGA